MCQCVCTSNGGPQKRSLSVHTPSAFISPLSSQTMTHKQSPDPAEPWDAVDTVSCGLWSYCPHLWSQVESQLQLHTWEGWVAFLRNALAPEPEFYPHRRYGAKTTSFALKRLADVSLGISTHVCKLDSTIFVVSEGKKCIPSQIVVIVRLNHSRQVCMVFWVNRGTKTDQMQRNDPWRLEELEKHCVWEQVAESYLVAHMVSFWKTGLLCDLFASWYRFSRSGIVTTCRSHDTQSNILWKLHESQ